MGENPTIFLQLSSRLKMSARTKVGLVNKHRGKKEDEDEEEEEGGGGDEVEEKKKGEERVI
jgi:hypothetical protein